jgi:UDP-2,4-diacetamido-2,4,6-trideoxy-beta-L-altropyranose hydrolase
VKAIIRVDSSTIIGTGHLMRCLTLADKLRQRGNTVEFISRDLAGNMLSILKEKEYRIHLLPGRNGAAPMEGYAAWLGVRWYIDAEETMSILSGQASDVLIVDHYALDARWEERQRPYIGRLVVIDDLANRHHDCDLLLDQNLYHDPEIRYEMLLPDDCNTLIGPKFALLREEFFQHRSGLRKRNGQVKNILVFFGGADPGNETAKALVALGKLNRPDVGIEIIIGRANGHIQDINKLAENYPQMRVHHQANNMAELMAQSDLAIGAGGTATWERCCLGLPSIIISVAKNQTPIAKMCHEAGIAVYLGEAEEVSAIAIHDALVSLLEKPSLLHEMECQALEICDGQGADRVFAQLGRIGLSEIKR